jgi:hypothetical protein
VGPAARNVGIVLVLAVAVAFLPGGGRTADFVGSFLSIAVLTSIVLILARMYRENRVTIFGLGDKHRALLYGAIAAFVVAMAGRDRLLDEDSGPGIVIFFALMGAAVYALYLVWRHHREYGI